MPSSRFVTCLKKTHLSEFKHSPIPVVEFLIARVNFYVSPNHEAISMLWQPWLLWSSENADAKT
jgi:hypothetical protein